MGHAARLAEARDPRNDIYPTRGPEERVLDRVDPVVHGDGTPQGPHSLSRDQLDRYARDGFLVVPGVFSRNEVDALYEEYVRLADSDRLDGREELVLEPDSDLPRSIFSPHRFSALYDRLVRDRRIIDKVKQVLGSEVYVHQARINIKRSFNGKSFPWHSDFETWHAEDGLPRCRVVSAWVMLTDNDEFNGPLFLVPGSHRRFVSCAGATPEDHHRTSLRRQEFGVPSLGLLREMVSRYGIDAAKGRAGTLVLHEGNTLHGSPDNISPTPRTNLFFVYNSVDNPPAAKPFAADRFRPRYLGSHDTAPLEPVANAFEA